VPRRSRARSSRYTVPEEVCGPLSLAGLEHDRYERVTAGYLPAASGAFLDEIGKANSSILNSLLTILNEREFDNGGQRVKIPLEIVVGASNELFTDDALRALDDRFLLRHWVEPVKNRSAVKSLLQGRGAPKVAASLQTGDLEVLRAAAQAVTVTDEVADAMLDLKDSLNREHGIQCSDRRWRKMVELVCARAAIRGGAQTEKADLLVLADSIWRTIDERPTVQAVVSKAVSPALGDALRLKDAAMEIVAKVDKAGKGSQATAALATASGEVTKLVAQIKALNGAATDPQIQAIVKEVEAVKQELAKTAAAALGLTF
jgi:MoxR-like ATPase